MNFSPVTGLVRVSSACVTKASAGGGVIQSGSGPGVTSKEMMEHALDLTKMQPF